MNLSELVAFSMLDNARVGDIRAAQGQAIAGDGTDPDGGAAAAGPGEVGDGGLCVCKRWPKSATNRFGGPSTELADLGIRHPPNRPFPRRSFPTL